MSESWRVLYTKHKTQKAKRWQDGKLKAHPNGKLVLLDDSGAAIDSMFAGRSLAALSAGSDLEFDGFLVTVEERDGGEAKQEPKPVAPPPPKPQLQRRLPRPLLRKTPAPKAEQQEEHRAVAAAVPHRTGREILALFRRKALVEDVEAEAAPPPSVTVRSSGKRQREEEFDEEEEDEEESKLVPPPKPRRGGFECPRRTTGIQTPQSGKSVSVNDDGSIPVAASSKPVESLRNLRFPSLEEATELAAAPPPNLPDSFPSLSVYISELTAAMAREVALALGEFSTNFHSTVAASPSVLAARKKSGGGQRQSCPHGNATVHFVKKAGPNKGRQFLKCPRGCFIWVDDESAPDSAKKSLSELLGTLGKRDEEHLKAQGIALYLNCELARGYSSFRHKDSKRSAATIGSLHLSLPWREASSSYARDDLWILFPKKSADGGPFLFSSVFHGPARGGELEIAPMPPGSRSPLGPFACAALHGPNISTEISMLANVAALGVENAPILSFLLNPHPSPDGDAPPMQRTLNDEEEMIIQSTIAERQLNNDQITVVRECVRVALDPNPDPPVVLVHGVFGSGKSSVLVAVFELLERLLNCMDEADPAMGTRILFVGATNVAVDRVLTQLVQEGFTSLIRVGSRKKIAKELFPFTLHNLGSDEDDVAELKDMLQAARTPAEAESIREEIRAVSEGQLGRRRELIETVRVVGATCAACAFPVLEGCRFRLVVLDECSQMVEPLSLLALGKFGCERAVLVGDPQQLRPVLLSSLALDSADACRTRAVHEGERPGEGLSKTLFMRLNRCGLAPIMLRTQYRCHPAISAIANKLFYENKLIDGVSAEDRPPLVEGLPPIVLCHTDHGKEEADRFGSYFNEQEAQAVAALAEVLVRGFGVESGQIGIIALYKAQVTRISSLLSARGGDIAAVQVSTVDAMQGAERDVILLSCSRTERLGFSLSPKRLNVAFSRGRRHLIVFGNAPLLTSNPAWQEAIGSAIATPGGLQSCSRLISTGELELPIVETE